MGQNVMPLSGGGGGCKSKFKGVLGVETIISPGEMFALLWERGY